MMQIIDIVERLAQILCQQCFLYASLKQPLDNLKTATGNLTGIIEICLYNILYPI